MQGNLDTLLPTTKQCVLIRLYSGCAASYYISGHSSVEVPSLSLGRRSNNNRYLDIDGTDLTAGVYTGDDARGPVRADRYP